MAEPQAHFDANPLLAPILVIPAARLVANIVPRTRRFPAIEVRPMIHLTTRQASQTMRLGEWIGRRLAPGTTVGLDGDLGMGKTWMAKGLVKGIGDYDETLVKSPAFNLVHEYPVVQGQAIQQVIHIDFYRLEELASTDFLLFSEYFERPGVITLVEWAGKFLAELVPSYLSVTLSACAGRDLDCREVLIGAVGSGYQGIQVELEQYANAGA